MRKKINKHLPPSSTLKKKVPKKLLSNFSWPQGRDSLILSIFSLFQKLSGMLVNISLPIAIYLLITFKWTILLNYLNFYNRPAKNTGKVNKFDTVFLSKLNCVKYFYFFPSSGLLLEGSFVCKTQNKIGVT